MMKHLPQRLIGLSLIFALSGATHEADAQLVFIPDPDMRTWLNQNVPGVVDGGGYMDTTYAGIASFTNTSIMAGFPLGPVDLTGLQYLDGLVSLGITVTDPAVVIPAFPTSLEGLNLMGYGAATLPALPQTLLYLDVHMCNALSTLPSLPNGAVMVTLKDLPSLTALPVLPTALTTLWVEGLTLLQNIPSLPAALEDLTIMETGISQVPTLPTDVIEVQLENLATLSSLPSWPASLDLLLLHQLPLISSLPPFPNALDLLHMTGMPLVSSVPALPSGLTSLELGAMPGIPDWPILPGTLGTLEISSMPFGTLPPLPPGLHTLAIEDLPGVFVLSSLPAGVTGLYVYSMPDLVALPFLPYGLVEMHVAYLPNLLALPALPSSLQFLRLIDCDNVPCLPTLPTNLWDLEVGSVTINCLPNVPPNANLSLSFDPSNICVDPCVTDMPLVGGRIYHDQNGNGTQDLGESGLAGATATLAPGNVMIGTDLSGRYQLTLPPGSYSLSAAASLNYPQASQPSVHSTTLVAATDVDTTNHFGITFEPGHYDLGVEIMASPARPGFDNLVWITVVNGGTEPTGGEVTLVLDDDQSFVSSTVTPSSVIGQELHWTLTPIPVGAVWSAEVTLATSALVPIGTALDHSIEVIADATDEEPADNSNTWTDVVVGSYDPNDKHCQPEHILIDDLVLGERVNYRIRFQNTGTAATSFVEIVDTLSTDLQWSSFQFEASSHPCTWVIENGVLRSHFDPLLLPDSTTDPLGSQGYVLFSVLPSASLLPGDAVANVAHILFDYNPPITTAPAIFDITVGSGMSASSSAGWDLYPVPAIDVLYVRRDPDIVGPALIEIFDGQGRRVLVQEARGSTEGIAIDALAPGSYVVVAPSGKGKWHGRFVKER